MNRKKGENLLNKGETFLNKADKHVEATENLEDKKGKDLKEFGEKFRSNPIRGKAFGFGNFVNKFQRAKENENFHSANVPSKNELIRNNPKSECAKSTIDKIIDYINEIIKSITQKATKFFSAGYDAIKEHGVNYVINYFSLT